MPITTTPDYSADTAFLKSVARRLVANEAAADDLVQEVWLVSLGRELPCEVRRAWMAKAARYLAMRSRRDRMARTQREHRHDEDRPSELREHDVEQASTRQFLAEQLTTLGPPISEALRLVYLEQMTIEQAAAQLEEPVGTVKSRIHRGLERLRERLVGRYGSGQALGLGLIEAFEWEPGDLEALGPAASAGGALTTIAAAWWACAAVILLAPLAWWGLARGDSTATDEAQVASPRAPEDPSETPILVDLEGASARDVVPIEDSTAHGTSSAESDTQPAEEEAATWAEVPVTVRDPSGRLVPGATVHVIRSGGQIQHRGTAGADGTTRIALEADDRWPEDDLLGRHVVLYAGSEDWAQSDRHHLRVEEGGVHALTITLPAPRLDLHGHVFDAQGRPVVNALVQAGAQAKSVQHSSDLVVLRGAVGARTDDEGAFSLCQLPRGDHNLVVRAEGYRTATTTVDGAGEHEVDVEIHLEVGGTLTGSVFDADSQLVSGARVYRHAHGGWLDIEAFTDEGGAFRLSGLPGGRAQVWASHGDQAAMAWVDVLSGEEQEVEFRLEDGHRLRVRPRFAEGDEPQLEGCMAYTEELDWVRTARERDAEGCYVFTDCPDDRDLNLALRDARYRGTVGFLAGVRPGVETVEVDCRLPGGGVASLRGHVTLPSEVLDGEVELKLVSVRERLGQLLDLDSNGGFSIDRLVPGAYVLDLTLPGLGRIVLAEFDLAGGEDRALGTLAVPKTAILDIQWVWEQQQLTWRIARRIERDGRLQLQTVRSGIGPPEREITLLPDEYTWIVDLPKLRHLRSFRLRTGGRLDLISGPMAAVPVYIEVKGTGPVDLVATAVDGGEVDVTGSTVATAEGATVVFLLKPMSWKVTGRTPDGQEAEVDIEIKGGLPVYEGSLDLR